MRWDKQVFRIPRRNSPIIIQSCSCRGRFSAQPAALTAHLAFSERQKSWTHIVSFFASKCFGPPAGFKIPSAGGQESWTLIVTFVFALTAIEQSILTASFQNSIASLWLFKIEADVFSNWSQMLVAVNINPPSPKLNFTFGCTDFLNMSSCITWQLVIVRDQVVTKCFCKRCAVDPDLRKIFLQKSAIKIFESPPPPRLIQCCE